MSNFAAANGYFYCKPHYQQLFKSVGGKYTLGATPSQEQAKIILETVSHQANSKSIGEITAPVEHSEVTKTIVAPFTHVETARKSEVEILSVDSHDKKPVADYVAQDSQVDRKSAAPQDRNSFSENNRKTTLESVPPPTLNRRTYFESVPPPTLNRKSVAELVAQAPQTYRNSADENIVQGTDSVQGDSGVDGQDLKLRIKQYEDAVNKSTEALTSAERLAPSKSNEKLDIGEKTAKPRSLSISSSAALLNSGTEQRNSISNISEDMVRRKSIRLKEKLKTPDSSTVNLFSEYPTELHEISSTSNKNITQALSSVINEEDNSRKSSSSVLIAASRKSSSKRLSQEFGQKTDSLKKINRTSSSGLSLHDIAPKETIKVETVLQPLRDRMAVLERSTSMKASKSNENTQSPTGLSLKERLNTYQQVLSSEKDSKVAKNLSRANTTLHTRREIQRGSKDILNKEEPVKPVIMRAVNTTVEEKTQTPPVVVASSIKDRMNSYQQNLKKFDESKGVKVEIVSPTENVGEQSAIKTRMNAYQSSLKKFEENQGEKYIEKQEKLASPAIASRKEDFTKNLVKDQEFNIETQKKDLFKGDATSGYIPQKSPEQKQEIATMVEKAVKKTIKIRNGESVVDDEPKVEIVKVDDRPTNVNISKRMNVWEQRIQQSTK